MKTASDLAEEYWNIPPNKRINSTLQDYVFDYQQTIINELSSEISSLYSLVSYDTEFQEQLLNDLDKYKMVAEIMEDFYLREMDKVKHLQGKLANIIDACDFHIKDCTSNQPMVELQVGWLEAMMLIRKISQE